MENMSHVLCCAEVLHDVVKVPEVSVCGVAAFCAGEGYSCHNVWSALGEIQEDTEQTKICVVIRGLRCWICILWQGRVGVERCLGGSFERWVQ